jgi:hypothetical protein
MEESASSMSAALEAASALSSGAVSGGKGACASSP